MMILFAAVLLAGCNSATEKKDATDTDQATTSEFVEVVINVDGMTCGGCENSVNAGVESLAGIASVESSHKEGWTKVKYDKALTSVEDIESKITDTGYTVREEL